jgi:hypothetical protein
VAWFGEDSSDLSGNLISTSKSQFEVGLEIHPKEDEEEEEDRKRR